MTSPAPKPQETPRTDAAMARINMETVVSVDFARQLERELASERLARMAAEGCIQDAFNADWNSVGRLAWKSKHGATIDQALTAPGSPISDI